MDTDKLIDYWGQKTLCALRWIVMLNAMPMLSVEGRREIAGENS
jgi:hypothetical protein